MLKFAFIALAAALPAIAQIGAGLKVGLPLNDALDVIGSRDLQTETKRYIIGPQFELRLPAGFSIELDALYTNFNASGPLTAVGSGATAVLDGDSWEFPLMLKKKFGRGLARPFVGAGASFRRLGGLKNIGSFITGSSDNDIDRNNTGFVIGAGIELRLLFLRISPEIRFTRWGTDHFSEGVRNVLKTNRNQGQLLVGFSF